MTFTPHRFRSVAAFLVAVLLVNGFLPLIGHACMRMAHEGMAHEDMAHEGMAHEGMSHEGMSHEGMSHEGMSHEGMSHEGMSHEGMSHEGMMPAAAPMPAADACCCAEVADALAHRPVPLPCPDDASAEAAFLSDAAGSCCGLMQADAEPVLALLARVEVPPTFVPVAHAALFAPSPPDRPISVRAAETGPPLTPSLHLLHGVFLR